MGAPRSSSSAMPGIAISIVIFAAGAIMKYAITTPTPGFNLNTAGIILMIVGVVCALVSLLLWSSASPFGRHSQVTRRRSTRTVDEDGIERGTVVKETRVSDSDV